MLIPVETRKALATAKRKKNFDIKISLSREKGLRGARYTGQLANALLVTENIIHGLQTDDEKDKQRSLTLAVGKKPLVSQRR